MTSYTKIGDDERPSISIDPSLTIAKIEDNVYGGFTEYAKTDHLPLTPSQLTSSFDHTLSSSLAATPAQTPTLPCPPHIFELLHSFEAKT